MLSLLWFHSCYQIRTLFWWHSLSVFFLIITKKFTEWPSDNFKSFNTIAVLYISELKKCQSHTLSTFNNERQHVTNMRLKVPRAMKTHVVVFSSLVGINFILKMVAICSSEMLVTSTRSHNLYTTEYYNMNLQHVHVSTIERQAVKLDIYMVWYKSNETGNAVHELTMLLPPPSHGS